jgi:hypothetical protein
LLTDELDKLIRERPVVVEDRFFSTVAGLEDERIILFAVEAREKKDVLVVSLAKMEINAVQVPRRIITLDDESRLWCYVVQSKRVFPWIVVEDQRQPPQTLEQFRLVKQVSWNDTTIRHA